MYRKAFIVMVAVLLRKRASTFQILTAFLVVTVALSFHFFCNPFQSPKVDRVETFSLIAIAVTFFAGMFFAISPDLHLKEFTIVFEVVIGVIVLLCNITFLIIWLREILPAFWSKLQRMRKSRYVLRVENNRKRVVNIREEKKRLAADQDKKTNGEKDKASAILSLFSAGTKDTFFVGDKCKVRLTQAPADREVDFIKSPWFKGIVKELHGDPPREITVEIPENIMNKIMAPIENYFRKKMKKVIPEGTQTETKLAGPSSKLKNEYVDTPIAESANVQIHTNTESAGRLTGLRIFFAQLRAVKVMRKQLYKARRRKAAQSIQKNYRGSVGRAKASTRKKKLAEQIRVNPGETFEKTWKFNTGPTGWPKGSALVCVTGEPLVGVCLAKRKRRKSKQPGRVMVPPAFPNVDTSLTIKFTAPPRSGHFESMWRMTTADGAMIGKQVELDVFIAQVLANEEQETLDNFL